MQLNFKQMLGCDAHVRIIALSHVRAEVRAERFLELCVRCVCVLLVLGVRCAIALFHLFSTYIIQI